MIMFLKAAWCISLDDIVRQDDFMVYIVHSQILKYYRFVYTPDKKVCHAIF